MGFLCGRVKPSNMKSLWSHLSRSYHYQASAFIANYSSNSQIRVFDSSNSALTHSPHYVFPLNVRFFAAPVQVKSKQETKASSGPRLNEKILADIIRLVTDNGHDVVPRMEALRRAKALDLDLVEVDRNAKPPVCKIMDYHKEKYNKQVKDKDRAKSKSEVTLRKGDCKEVRFSMKIEQKDLEMKANTVKKMMERGYRVKCMAMGKEEEDLGGLVARLSALIEDVAVVESGPRVEKKQAYIVVRHIKFGLPKKGGSPKKPSKTVESPNPGTEIPTDTNSSPFEDDEIPDQSALETDDESPLEENRYKRTDSTPVLDNTYKRPDNPPVMENRYSRVNNPVPAESRYINENRVPVPENRYSRVNNSVPADNRYNNENRVPVPENRYSRLNNSVPAEDRYNNENRSPVPDNRYSRVNNSIPAENRYSNENRVPVPENRYSRVNNSVPSENRYSNENRVPVPENRYSRVNNSIPADNRYSNENRVPVPENRYNRVNNPAPTENRYNRDNNAPAAENRYRRDQQYNPNVEAGSERVNSFTQFRPQENRYKTENSFERQPWPQGGPLAPPYSDGR